MAPLLKIGERFRVERTANSSGFLATSTPTVTIDAVATGQYLDAFVVSTREHPSFPGTCQVIIESWSGAGSAFIRYTLTGSLPYASGPQSWAGDQWQVWNVAPQAFPLPATLVAFPMFNHPVCADPAQGHFCGYAYPRPAAVAGLVLGPILSMMNRARNQAPQGMPPLNSFAPTNFALMPAAYFWYGLPCAGFEQKIPGGGGYDVEEETWTNIQGGMSGRAQWVLERRDAPSGGGTTLNRISHTATVSVTTVTPCIGGGRPDPNASAIAEHNGRGLRDSGCCW